MPASGHIGRFLLSASTTYKHYRRVSVQRAWRHSFVIACLMNGFSTASRHRASVPRACGRFSIFNRFCSLFASKHSHVFLSNLCLCIYTFFTHSICMERNVHEIHTKEAMLLLLLLCPLLIAGALSDDDGCLTSVCLSRTSGLSREQRGLGRPRLAQR